MQFNKEIRIGDFCISSGSACFIIAEAGVNHCGDVIIAKKMIDAASEAGVDAVKFQIFKTEDIILKVTEKAPYQKESHSFGKTQFEMLKSLELSADQHKELFDYCNSKRIIYLCTPYDLESLNILVKLGVKAIKVASTDATNLFFLEEVARRDLPVILSTGMSDLIEIEKAYECLSENGCKDLIMLHCASNYPVKPEEVNLRAMVELGKRFDVLVGYSDHTEQIGAAAFAVVLGAKVLEKHFTLDRKMEGPDHKASIEPHELKNLVEQIRYAERIIGSGEKKITESEKITKMYLQKYIVAKRPIKKGETIALGDLTAKRTGGVGTSPIEREKLAGRVALKDIEKDEPIRFEYVK